MEDLLTPLVTFVLGVVGTLLVEWRFRPRFERNRRREERREADLRQLIELLQIRLPRLAKDLNHLLGMASYHRELEAREDLTSTQREAAQVIIERDRDAVKQLHDSWEEATQTASVLTQRVARYDDPSSMKVIEGRSFLHSGVYFTPVFQFRRGDIPSGDYKTKEETQREHLLTWAESELRNGPPRRKRTLPLRRGTQSRGKIQATNGDRADQRTMTEHPEP